MTNTTMTVLSESEDVVTTKLVINVYIDSLLCLLGFVGNIGILYVLNHEKHVNSNIFLMKVLAVYDILFLIHTLIYTVLRSALQIFGPEKIYYEINPYIVTLDLPFGWIAQTGTIWITMLLAMDRYWAISRPFQAICICTVRNARIATAVTTVLAILFNLPRFPYYYRVATQSTNNETFVAHVKIDLPNWDDDLYRYLYHITLTFIFLYIIPLTSLTVFNYLLICVLRRAKRARARMSVTTSTQSSGSLTIHNTTVTLNMVIVITKFIICETPDFISGILASINEVSLTDEYKIYNCFKEMLLICNSVLNFYIYCLFNSRFRNTLLVSCRCRKRPTERQMSVALVSCSSLNPVPATSTTHLQPTAMVSKSTQT